jgi:hypothetical protein
MLVLGRRSAAILVALLGGPLLWAEYEFPAQTRGDMEARLTVTVPSKAAEPGFAEATLTLTVTGPATLEVEAPRLGDAAAAWKDERQPIRREGRGERTTWSQVLRLKQVKPGMEPMADVTVRFRPGPDSDWVEAKWINILREMREGREAPPPEATRQSSWWRRWGYVLLWAMAVLIVVTWWSKRRERRERRETPLPSHRWALREIDRLEQSLLTAEGDAETYHTQMSYVVRRYLMERFGLHALQQTTAEFLQAIRQTPQLSAEQQTLLSELFERCDLAKFARVGTPPEECRRTAELARELVRRTPPVAS